MTEQETREKIINIIREFNVRKRRYSTYTEPNDDEELADALIAAGIGDVSEYKKESSFYRCEIAFLYEKINELEKTARKLQKGIRDKIATQGRFEFCGADGKEYLTIRVDKLNEIIKAAEYGVEVEDE